MERIKGNSMTTYEIANQYSSRPNTITQKETTDKEIIDRMKEELTKQGFTFTEDGKFITPNGYTAEALGEEIDVR
jgi:hypothetical protein